MKAANKVFIIVMACLLALGAVCLAFGIMLGGSVGAVFQAVWDAFAGVLNLVTIFTTGF